MTIFRLFDKCPFHWHPTLSHCSFDLYFPKPEWQWALFQMPIRPPYFLFGKASFYFLDPFMDEAIGFFVDELGKCFISLGEQPFIWCVVLTYFLLFSRLVFFLLLGYLFLFFSMNCLYKYSDKFFSLPTQRQVDYYYYLKIKYIHLSIFNSWISQ